MSSGLESLFPSHPTSIAIKCYSLWVIFHSREKKSSDKARCPHPCYRKNQCWVSFSFWNQWVSKVTVHVYTLNWWFGKLKNMLWFVTLDWRFKKSQNGFWTLNWSSKTSRIGLKNVFGWLLDTPQYYCQFFVSSFIRITNFLLNVKNLKPMVFSLGVFVWLMQGFLLVANPTCFFFFCALCWKKLGIFYHLMNQESWRFMELDVLFSRFLGRKSNSKV